MNDEHHMNSYSAASGLKAESFDALVEALEILYIQNNISGRLNFYKEWPAAAERIFGADLIRFDTEGADDYELRASLEEEADERRSALLEQLQDVVEKSVVKSALQTEFVAETINTFGREFALLVYHEKIVNRYAPAGPVDAPHDEAEIEVRAPNPEAGYAAFQQTKAGMSDEEKAALEKKRAAAMEEDFTPRVPEDPFDAIQPISVEINAPLSTEPQPKPEDVIQTPEPKPASLPDGFYEIEEPVQVPEISKPASRAPVEQQETNQLQDHAEMQPPPKQPEVFSSPSVAAAREGVIASDKHVFELPNEPEAAKPPPVVNTPVINTPASTPSPVVSDNQASASTPRENAAPEIFTVPKKEAPREDLPKAMQEDEPPQQRVTMKFVSSKKSDKEPKGGSDT